MSGVKYFLQAPENQKPLRNHRLALPGGTYGGYGSLA